MEEFWITVFAILVVVVLGVAIYTYPGLLALLLGIPLLLVLGWGVFQRRDYITGKTERSLRLAIINPLRALFARPLIWLLPEENIKSGEREMLVHANRLVAEVKDALDHSPIAGLKKASFNRQARDVPRNVAEALWKLSRIRRIGESIGNQYGSQHRQELVDMDRRILAELRHSLEVFTSMPVALIKVELAHGNIATDRLLADLSEANQRLRDLSSGYAEVRELRMS